MNKIFLSIATLLLIFALVACNSTTDNGTDSGINNDTGENSGNDNNNDNNTGGNGDGNNPGDNGSTSPEDCEHQYELRIDTPAKALADGKGTQICTLCNDEYGVTLPATKTLKVLAVGNSFSVDAMEYLWG